MKSAKPRERECHINVDRYVLENPGCKTIRGWLVVTALSWGWEFSPVSDAAGLLSAGAIGLNW